MAGAPQFVDISAYQPLNIDWKAYRAWSAQWDGIARVSLKSSFGTGYTDEHFATYREGAINAGIDIIIFYHYAYPQYNSAVAEADYQHQIVGDIRPNDVLMLDFEENVPQATAEWAYEWLARQEQNYGGKLPTIYANDAFIRARLQDARFARFPLTLANWQFTPAERPACPPPWKTYVYLQYTDKATAIPGIPGAVDADIYLGPDGGATKNTIPAGWHDDGQTLTAPNQQVVIHGFREHILKTAAWDPQDVPLEREHFQNPLEEGYSQPENQGSRQTFTYSMLAWNPVRNVYRVGLGNEFLFVYNDRARLRSQIATALQQLAALQQQLSAPGATLAQARAQIQAIQAQLQQLPVPVGR